ncbi:MAG TPA: right-handed parallel beta-helix repeat-containing protein [Tepidisphaeraceae bacterium]|jgi:hypothetical protein|nr:right-handed parallel beta-helix repeat-containing protein [Tepidisphaeraceae bacterium]
MAKSSSLAAISANAARQSRIIPEFLETRLLMSVTQNAAGWTVITPTASDHVIYCSNSSGSDSNNGLSTSKPVKTLAHAISLLRNKTGDELLLKDGDTWSGGLGTWTKSGASASDPMVIGSYGSGARPILDTGTSPGITTGSASIPEVDYLAIMGISIYANSRDPSVVASPATSDPTGINILTKSNDILIENCQIKEFTENINLQDYYGPLTNISVRRNVIVDSYSKDTHSQGMYALGVKGLLIEGNVFDHNGWNSSVSGAGATIYNHDAYISSNNSGVVVDDNTFSQASATGLQDRPGGIVVNNLFVNDAVDMTFGLVNGADTTVGGVSGIVAGNVYIGGANTGSISQGIGLEVGNIKANSGTLIASNIFSQGESGAGPAMMLEAGTAQIDPQDSVGINDLSIRSNTFYSWTIGIDMASGMTAGGSGLTAFNRVTYIGNQFDGITKTAVENTSTAYLAQETWSGNTYYNSKGTGQGTVITTPPAFPAPSRSVSTYDASIGGSGTLADFLSRVRAESEANWNNLYQAPSVISYIAAGF